MGEPDEFTDPPDVRGPDEEPPPFDELDAPADVLGGGPVRERLFDVVLQLREPTKVSTVAERADCDPETARDYLGWFASMGVVRAFEGRPARYERNDAYLRWRRVEQVRATRSADEIAAELADVLDDLEAYRERFDADDPDEVSLVELSRERPTEEAWEALSEWRTLRRRAEVLDAARREDRGPGGRAGTVDV